MMTGLASCLVLIALLCGFKAHAREQIDFSNPIGTAADDEVKNLPGLDEAITFRQFSGYLKADEDGKKFLHYWFFEATEDPINKPVLLWLNGGPGCSSMEGLFSELGPFQLDGNGQKVTLRKYSWNKLANVIFLESPAGVGYSYTTDPVDFENDDTVAQSNYLALKSFFDKFPQYKTNKLYLSGESYAGVYLPTLGVLIDADKQFNMKGIAIGNGYLDASKLSDSLVFFLYHHGFFGKSFWDDVSTQCCNGKPPARENCDFSDSNSFCSSGISEACYQLFMLNGFNAYNMYGDCPGTDQPEKASHLTRWNVDALLRKVSSMHRSNHTVGREPFVTINPDLMDSLSLEPPCFDGYNMINYMNDAKVRKAIHIPENLGSWDVCSSLVYSMIYPLQEGGLAPQMRQLIKSDRKLTLLVFNGDTDLVCNALGDEWFVDDLGQKMIAEYAPWKVDQQIGGWVKHYEGITFATVRGSGHMVPEYRPKEAFHMISVVLNSKSQNVML